MARTYVIPSVRSQDKELALVRNIAESTASLREDNVAVTQGEPLTEFAGDSNPYIDFHRNDVLLSLQHMRSDSPDEMTFILETQVTELLLKATHFELVNAQTRIRAGDVEGAVVLLKRARLLIEQISNTWQVLSTITPAGFNLMRDHLGVGSGQQSYMYRHVEFVLGNKSVTLAGAHRNNPEVWPALEAALNGPSLWDDVTALLVRRGRMADNRCAPDPTARYEERDDVREAWRRIYEDADVDDEFYRLGEALVDLAEIFTHFRWKHFVGVQRILGLKPGTGGSAGVGWLRGITTHRFFPELWSLRNDLG
jgi:tryptophan 2,3-dioxygenase